MTYTHGSLFSGIGGFDLGFERAGFKTIWQVEIDEWKRSVLAANFPDVLRLSNVRECGEHNLSAVEVISGGFPCQPFSTSGKRQGADDDRYLWPEMLRVVRALRPRFVVAENVAGMAHEFDWVLEQVCDDLEAEGYETLPPLMVPACAFGAWHRRDRIWILAHIDQGIRCAQQEQQQAERPQELHGRDSIPAHADGDGWNGEEIHAGRRKEGPGAPDPSWRSWWDAEPGVGRMVHGISSDMDRRRIAALGEAVVPQIAQWIGERILIELSRNHEDRG